MKAKLDTSRTTKVTNLMPRAQIYCSGCVLGRALGIRWMRLAGRVAVLFIEVLWFIDKVFQMKRHLKTPTKPNPKTYFQGIQDMYKGQGVVVYATLYLFYFWFVLPHQTFTPVSHPDAFTRITHWNKVSKLLVLWLKGRGYFVKQLSSQEHKAKSVRLLLGNC